MIFVLKRPAVHCRVYPSCRRAAFDFHRLVNATAARLVTTLAGAPALGRQILAHRSPFVSCDDRFPSRDGIEDAVPSTAAWGKLSGRAGMIRNAGRSSGAQCVRATVRRRFLRCGAWCPGDMAASSQPSLIDTSRQRAPAPPVHFHTLIRLLTVTTSNERQTARRKMAGLRHWRRSNSKVLHQRRPTGSQRSFATTSG